MLFILPELVARIRKMTLGCKQREKMNDHLQWICVKTDKAPEPTPHRTLLKVHCVRIKNLFLKFGKAK